MRRERERVVELGRGKKQTICEHHEARSGVEMVQNRKQTDAEKYKLGTYLGPKIGWQRTKSILQKIAEKTCHRLASVFVSL